MREKYSRLGLAVLLAGCALLPSQAGATNGYRRIGYGVQAQGVGGAAIAFPQDAFAAAANPAGLTALCDRLDIGVDWVRQNQRLTAPLEVIDQESCPGQRSLGYHSDDDFFYPEVAVNRWVCCDQAFGLAVFGFGGWQTEFGANLNPESEIRRAVGMEYRQYFVTPTWSWQFNECQSIGVSFNLAVAYIQARGLGSEFFITDDVSSWTIINTSAGPNYVTDKGKDYELGAGVKVGWMGDLFCGLVGGATYQSPTWVNKFKRYRGFIALDGDMHLPDIWGLGLSYCICGQVMLAIDFERIMWTHTKMFRNDLYTRGPGGTGVGLFPIFWGNTDGIGFGWDDQNVLKIGLAWDVCEWGVLRVGYNWGENPVDVDNLRLNVLTSQILTNHFTLGLTWYWACCGEISLSYIHGTSRTIRCEGLALRNKQDSIGLAFARVF